MTRVFLVLGMTLFVSASSMAEEGLTGFSSTSTETTQVSQGTGELSAQREIARRRHRRRHRRHRRHRHRW